MRFSEFEDSKDKIMMGAERPTMVMTEQEKMLTAYPDDYTKFLGRDIEVHISIDGIAIANRHADTVTVVPNIDNNFPPVSDSKATVPVERNAVCFCDHLWFI